MSGLEITSALATLIGQIAVISAAFTDRKKSRRNRAMWGPGLISTGFVIRIVEDLQRKRMLTDAKVANLQ